jgi:nicotinate-nucleotide--dimethylbenzimidazole phosphoribosyltransferase
VALNELPELGATLTDLLQWWNHHSDGKLVRFQSVLLAESDSGTDEIDAAVDSGANLLALIAPNTAPAAYRAITSVLTGAEPDVLIAQVPGMSDTKWMEQVAICRDLAADIHALRGDHGELVQAAGAAHLTRVANALLAASDRRTPVLLEGATSWTAALLADRMNIRAKAWWYGAGTSADPAVRAASARVGISSGLDLELPSESRIGVPVHLAALGQAIEFAQEQKVR